MHRNSWVAVVMASSLCWLQTLLKLTISSCKTSNESLLMLFQILGHYFIKLDNRALKELPNVAAYSFWLLRFHYSVPIFI